MQKKQVVENWQYLNAPDYPADVQDVNLLTIPYMRKKFSCEIGLSDHTKGIGTSIGAIAHGASIIEKHFLPKYIKKV